jgi:hypothetical protein
LTDGVIGQRLKVAAWLIAEERDTAYDGGREADNPLREATSIRVSLLAVDVRIGDQFGIQGAMTVPSITRTAVVPLATGPVDFSETFEGIGDTSVVGWYRLAPIRRWNVVVNAGVSLPTGRIERPRFRAELEGGSLVPMSRLQRGSGTLDPLFGVNVDRAFRTTTLFGSIAARVPVAENRFGLRTGASSEVSGGLARQLGTHRVTGFGRVGWLHRRQDVFGGTPVLVGGGNWVYLTPGVAVQVGKGINAQFEVKLPMYRSLANRQLDSSAIVQFGVSRSF